MLLQPSIEEFQRVSVAIEAASQGTYDMDIINSVYGDSCAVLPHRDYSILTGEFRRSTHSGFLRPYPKAKDLQPLPEINPTFVPQVVEPSDVWDPDAYFHSTKYIHFSDSPFPKPWITPGQKIKKYAPPCYEPSTQSDLSVGLTDPDAGEDCRERDIWLFLYSDFRERRLVSCSSISVFHDVFSVLI